MSFKIFFLFIAASSIIMNYNTDLNAKNGGRIRITIDQSETQAKIIKVAVFPFDIRGSAIYAFQGPAVADQYAEDFRRIGYNCIDRETISKTMKEQSLNPNVPVNLDTAIRIGKLLNADGIVLGEVIRIPDLYSYSWRYLINLVDVKTGKTVWHVDASDVLKGEIANRLKDELNRKTEN